MKKFFILIMILFAVSVHADEKEDYSYGKYTSGQKTYLFGDNVNVRKTPEIKDNITATLPIGTEITIVKDSGIPYKSKNYSENWYNVRFFSEGLVKEGFVWGGLIAKSHSSEKGMLYLTGITEYDSNSGPKGEVRLVRENITVTSLQIKFHDFPTDDITFYGYSVSSGIITDTGLTGIDSVLEIKMVYEACGAPNGSLFIARVGNRLIYITETTDVSEAGLFSYTEEVIFPGTSKKHENRILFKACTKKYDEESENYETTKEEQTFIVFKNLKFIKEQ